MLAQCRRTHDQPALIRQMKIEAVDPPATLHSMPMGRRRQRISGGRDQPLRAVEQREVGIEPLGKSLECLLLHLARRIGGRQRRGGQIARQRDCGACRRVSSGPKRQTAPATSRSAMAHLSKEIPLKRPKGAQCRPSKSSHIAGQRGAEQEHCATRQPSIDCPTLGRGCYTHSETDTTNKGMISKEL